MAGLPPFIIIYCYNRHDRIILLLSLNFNGGEYKWYTGAVAFKVKAVRYHHRRRIIYRVRIPGYVSVLIRQSFTCYYY